MDQNKKEGQSKSILVTASAISRVAQMKKEEKRKPDPDLLLENIYRAVEIYNNLRPEERIEIVRENLKVEQEVDVRNMFICVYNDEHVGLFRRERYRIDDLSGAYDAGNIYFGVDSDYIGMKRTHRGFHLESYWESPGHRIRFNDNDVFVCNCKMKNGMSFDDMRLKMYSEGLIGPYVIGKSNSTEMLNVLCYARSYYNLGTKGNVKAKK